MSDFFDTLETRSADQRHTDQMARLPLLVAHAQAHASAYGALLAGVDAHAVSSREALARLPVTHKHALTGLQQTRRALDPSDPFGGFSTIGWGALQRAGRGAKRVFQSPGPIYEPEGQAADHWRMARALHAAGLRAGDLVHNSFSYHLTPAGAMMESAALALGCTVFPGGVGQTDLQLQAMLALRPDAYVGTPSFLRILLDKADEQGLTLSGLTKASVGGEAFPPSLRDLLATRGVQAFQSYGTADLGLIAYETRAREGLVLDDGVIVEIVRPGTGEVLPDGEVGEVVVTVLNPDYPLIRFGTGDLSAVLAGPCPTGRTNTRIRGWMGRADQTAKVRGLFVHPAQVAEIGRRHPELGRIRLVVHGAMGDDHLQLRAEVAGVPEGLASRLAETVRDVTRLRCDITLCAPGSLPNDGKVIDDQRRLA